MKPLNNINHPMKKEELQKWLIMEVDGGWRVIIPETDSLPHSTDEEGFKRPLAGRECPCIPEIDWGQKLIIHNSFLQKAAIEKTISEL